MPRQPPMAGRTLLLCLGAAVVQQNCRVARAQIYQFYSDPVPANKSLHTLYAFYVYSQEEAPDSSQGKPFVRFSGLTATSTSPAKKDADLAAYKSLQLSILRYQDFWNLINPKKFCSTWYDMQQGVAEAADQLLVMKPTGRNSSAVDVYSSTIRFPNGSSAVASGDVKQYVGKTGVYILVFSNCGTFWEASISGTVVVKNAYGFLPGNEYYKMPFYGWLLLVYVGLAVAWMALSIRWWKELFNIQHCISAVILFGLLEAFLWYLFFEDWNKTGFRGRALFVTSILLTVVKSTFSYMLVLVASLGWGISVPFLDRQVILKIQVVCFFYIVLDFIREVVLSFRHSHSLSLVFVLLCLLPVSLLNGTMFYWVFTALSSSMETLKDRQQTEKLLLFQRLWRILIFALAVATFTLLAQIFNLSRNNITVRWKYQWLLTDGVSHAIFLGVLMAMMYLWAPHKYSQRYAFSSQLGDEESGNKPHAIGTTVWADDDEEDRDDSESFWATTHSRDGKAVAPADIIGAASEEDRFASDKL